MIYTIEEILTPENLPQEGAIILPKVYLLSLEKAKRNTKIKKILESRYNPQKFSLCIEGEKENLLFIVSTKQITLFPFYKEGKRVIIKKGNLLFQIKKEEELGYEIKVEAENDYAWLTEPLLLAWNHIKNN